MSELPGCQKSCTLTSIPFVLRALPTTARVSGPRPAALGVLLRPDGRPPGLGFQRKITPKNSRDFSSEPPQKDTPSTLGANHSRALRVCAPADHSGSTKEIKIMQSLPITQPQQLINTIAHGDCIEIMRQIPEASVDFILTDPPYLVNFHDRQGRTLKNDTDDNWLKPAMAEGFRVLKQNRLMLCFYGWPRAEKFLEAWHSAGFRPVGHLIFRKSYTTKARFFKYQHEQAYLLAKGNPPLPHSPLPDVQRLIYTGNKLHPTQK